jgi:hypothetical protein
MSDQHGSGSMQHQHALLFNRPHFRKSHVRTGDRFADRFEVVDNDRKNAPVQVLGLPF